MRIYTCNTRNIRLSTA